MTLLQAIEAADSITIFNGGMMLDIDKAQARSLHRQTDWVHFDKWDGGETCHWRIDEDNCLMMNWPQ